jgi:hypothetical protein
MKLKVLLFWMCINDLDEKSDCTQVKENLNVQHYNRKFTSVFNTEPLYEVLNLFTRWWR